MSNEPDKSAGLLTCLKNSAGELGHRDTLIQLSKLNFQGGRKNHSNPMEQEMGHEN